ncbi:MAG: translation initiation factor IF-3 [Waddliaceae bacterium]
MRINRKIRAPKIRVIGANGEQIGVLSVPEALKISEQEGLDLIEIAPNASPPVCKIMDYGKFRYDQTKREKESKKAQHQIKVKEVKVKPNIEQHDVDTKLRHAREFLSKGDKVKITCMYRGRERAHPEIGERVVQKMCEELKDIASPDTTPKMMGRFLTVVLSPVSKKK